MEYIVALALLVTVGACVVAAYARLHHLYGRVQGAWAKWNEATRRRNDCLGDFVAVFASFLPQEDMLPRDIRRWVEDSSRALEATPAAPLLGAGHVLTAAERQLRRMMTYSGRAMEATPRMRESDQLLGLYQAMAVSRHQQEEVAGYYNRSVHDYNAALNEPLTRLLAPVLGFAPVEEVQVEIRRSDSDNNSSK